MRKKTTAEYKTINVTAETKDALKRLKIIKREPYESVIQRLLKVNENTQRNLKEREP